MLFCYTLINPFPAEEEKEELLAAGIHLPARAGTPRCLGGDVFGDRKRLRLVREGPPLKAECCRWAEGRLLSPRTVALPARCASDEDREAPRGRLGGRGGAGIWCVPGAGGARARAPRSGARDPRPTLGIFNATEFECCRLLKKKARRGRERFSRVPCRGPALPESSVSCAVFQGFGPHATCSTTDGSGRDAAGERGGPSHHSSWHVPLSRDAGAKAPDTTLRHRATPKTSLPLRLPGRGRFERTLDFFVLFRF